ncbi:MAG: bifunctional oligoribonuclease/PAP phosphatase NrnA [Opitutales bacterium]|nr:bifunctional oligoribonuclease/PAP phosphatase NrnA [Opitutales bacterium]
MLALSSILALWKDSQPIYIVTHERPDGDAVGSQVALTLYLRHLQVPAFAFLTDDLSETFRPFFQNVPTQSLSEFSRQAHWVAVDAGNPTRVAEAVRSYPFTLVIDHHPEEPENLCWGSFRLIQPQQSSTCELLLDFFTANGYRMDCPAIQEALYLGLMSDTGNFSNTNTTAATFAHAEQLARAGVRPYQQVQRLYKNKTQVQWQLYSLFLRRVQVYAEGAVVISFLTEADYAQLGATRQDTEGFVNQLLLLKTAKVAAFLEKNTSYLKGSLRSCDPAYPVHTVAKHWGGFGHRCAAGFQCEPNQFSIDDLVQQLTATIASKA